MDSPNFKLNVFSLNIWGLPFKLSSNRKERVSALAKKLASSNYDVVCLQEVWVLSDYEIIKEETRENLPYSHYFHSGVIGSGLCVFSKHPIEDALYHSWPLNGYIHMIHHADWYGGKGVGLVQLNMYGYNINIYITHFHANYNPNSDSYLAHRITQAYDTASFIQHTSEKAHLSLLAGDLNSEPREICFRLLKNRSSLKDTFCEVDHNCDSGTCDAINNTFRKCDNRSTRIDYILFKPGENIGVNVLSYSLPLEDRIDEVNCSYSDHEAVAASLQLFKSYDKFDGNERQSEEYNDKGTFEDAAEVLDNAIKAIEIRKKFYFLGIVFHIVFSFIMLSSFPIVINIIFKIVVLLLIFFMLILLFYSFIMVTLWHFYEKKSLLSVRSNILLYCNKIKVFTPNSVTRNSQTS